MGGGRTMPRGAESGRGRFGVPVEQRVAIVTGGTVPVKGGSH